MGTRRLAMGLEFGDSVDVRQGHADLAREVHVEPPGFRIIPDQDQQQGFTRMTRSSSLSPTRGSNGSPVRK